MFPIICPTEMVVSLCNQGCWVAAVDIGRPMRGMNRISHVCVG